MVDHGGFQLVTKSLAGQGAVSPLGAGIAGDDFDLGADPPDQLLFHVLGQGAGTDVESKPHHRLVAIGVLAARSARSIEVFLEIPFGNVEPADPDAVATHVSS